MYDFFLYLTSFEPINKSLNIPKDIVAIPMGVIYWAMLFTALHFAVSIPLGKVVSPAPKDIHDKKYLKDRHKLHNAVWKFTSFTICVTMGLYIAFSEPWFFHPEQYFIGWPGQFMAERVKWYYQMEMSMYIFALLLMPFEPKQTVADIIVVLIHHAATLFLIGGSYLCGFYRIGVAVAVLHDFSDPFMEFAKLFLYAGKNTIANVFFGLFAVVFIINRNILFPVFVVYPIPANIVDSQGNLMVPVFFKNVFVPALWVLEVLHVYWAALIIRMTYKALVNNGVEDDIRNIEYHVVHKKVEIEE